MLNLDTNIESRRAMSLLEPRLSDLRSGFGGYTLNSSVSLPSVPLLPLWHTPPPGPAVSWCTIPNCPCALSRSHLLSELYDYSTSNQYLWSSWYLKAAQDPLYKGVPLPAPAPPPIEGPPVLPPAPEHVDYDARPSFGKELPTKMSMHERVKKWLEVSKPPKYEKEHHTIHKQNSSEPSLHRNSSPSPDHYRNGEPQPYNLHNYLPSHASMHSPPSRPPPCYPHSRRELPSPHEGPLNLTMNNNNNTNTGSHSPTQSRPSVITCTTLPDRRFDTNSNGSSSPSRKEPSTDICDPAIEEHFRRSLGKHYPEFLTRNPSVTPSPPPPVAPPRQSSPGINMTSSPQAPNKNVSITGSVDDHFARALGDSTWSALKPKNDQSETGAPHSVDDHFAKALGDTWLRLKDKKEQPRGPGAHPFPLSHPIPHPLPHPIPRAHSLPHPVPQRPASPSSQSHSGPLLST